MEQHRKQDKFHFWSCRCLRMDSLSQILTQANIQAHSRVLVVDGCNGLVLAALMEKMGGQCLSYSSRKKIFTSS